LSDLLIDYGIRIIAPFGKFVHLQKGRRLHRQLKRCWGGGLGALATFENFAPTEKTGLVHWNGSHFMKEPLRTSGLKEGAAGAVGEQSP
jgi:hypothetical protein